MKIKTLKVGDRVQYDSPTIIDGHHWIWQGYVESITWKYARIVWTHSNNPVFDGPIVENEQPSQPIANDRSKDDPTISLIPKDQ
jgi:hypothetical protein